MSDTKFEYRAVATTDRRDNLVWGIKLRSVSKDYEHEWEACSWICQNDGDIETFPDVEMARRFAEQYERARIARIKWVSQKQVDITP